MSLLGSSCENSVLSYRNPWNLDCVPGGSSGGQAAAVAGDGVYLGFGFGYRGGSIPNRLLRGGGFKPTLRAGFPATGWIALPPA